ncbi:hypothetical protein [Planococcus koreensis]|uniref:hypothetical protein n=1 Tax=Planococcus koreensis TaxID=112331 RepID=UPI0039FC0DE7
MRLNGQDIEERLKATNYIDTELKELDFNNSNHLVTMKYMGSRDEEVAERDYTILFEECFSVTFNTWLEGVQGGIPQSPHSMDFYFHDISIKDVVVNSVHLYGVEMVFPMMGCWLTSKSIEIVRSEVTFKLP